METEHPAPELSITVSVERLRRGHESRLGHARVTSGEPYVLAHHDAPDFSTLVGGLAATGHTFTVEIVDRDVALDEWFGGDPFARFELT